MLVSKSMSSPFISNSPLLNVYVFPPGAWDTVTHGWRAACFSCCHPINPLFPPAVLCDSWSNASVCSRRINCLRYLQMTKDWENILHDENPFKCPLKSKKYPDRLLPSLSIPEHKCQKFGGDWKADLTEFTPRRRCSGQRSRMKIWMQSHQCGQEEGEWWEDGEDAVHVIERPEGRWRLGMGNDHETSTKPT